MRSAVSWRMAAIVGHARGASMRSKLVPDSFAERLALWAGRVPGPIVDSIVPLLKARALMAAERLGVFEALRAGPRSPEAALRGSGGSFSQPPRMRASVT